MNRVCYLALCLIALSALAAEEPKPPHTDLYGDPLPPGAVMRLGTIRLRHANADIVFSKDGKQLISCDRDGEVRVWDAATGKLVRRHLLARKVSEEVSFGVRALSSDRKIVATWGNAIHLHDANSGKDIGIIASLNIKYPYLLSKFSLNGNLLALQMSGVDGESIMQIWDVNTIKKYQTLVMPAGVKLASVAFSWDGKRLVGSAENFVDLFLWDMTTGKLLVEKKNLDRFDANSLAFSPDGKTLAVGSRTEAVLRLLAADSLKEKSRLKVPTTSPKDSVVSGDPYYL